MTGSLKLISKRRAMFGDLLTYSPALICLAIMLPRLLSPQFGLFDDGNTVSVAHQVTGGGWDVWRVDADAGTGRFRPAYWLCLSLIYRLFGTDPLWYFLANGLAFAGITLGLICLTRAAGGSRLQAGTAGMLFALSSPAIESFYTLSKGEPLQLLWLVASLLVIGARSRLRKAVVRAGALLLGGFFIFLADATKETSLVMIPVSLAWFLAAWVGRKATHDRQRFQAQSTYFLATVLAGMVYLGLRASIVGQALAPGTYAGRYSLQLSQMLATGFRWAGWLTRDFSYLVPLASLLGACWVLRRRADQGAVLFDAFLWMVGWVIVFLPWGAPTVEYFLLPFAAGGSIFAGVVVGQASGAIADTSKTERALVVTGLVLTAGLFLVTLSNNAANGRQQLAVDAANADMLDYLASNLPLGSIVVVNIQDPNEYVDEIGLHLHGIWNRPDLVVDYFRYQEALLSPAASPPYYVVTPSVENQPRLAVRMGVVESTVSEWNDSMLEFLDGFAEPVYQTERHFRLLTIDMLRLFCPLFPRREYCHVTSPVIDRRVFSFGWTIYQPGVETQGFVSGLPLPSQRTGAWSPRWSGGARFAPQGRERAQ